MTAILLIVPLIVTFGKYATYTDPYELIAEVTGITRTDADVQTWLFIKVPPYNGPARLA